MACMSNAFGAFLAGHVACSTSNTRWYDFHAPMPCKCLFLNRSCSSSRNALLLQDGGCPQDNKGVAKQDVAQPSEAASDKWGKASHEVTIQSKPDSQWGELFACEGCHIGLAAGGAAFDAADICSLDGASRADFPVTPTIAWLAVAVEIVAAPLPGTDLAFPSAAACSRACSAFGG